MAKANSFECYPAFVIRTPLLAISNIAEIPANPEGLKYFIKQKWDNTIFRDAMIAASPEFANRIQSEIDKEHISDKLCYSFLRYYIRMSFRCTPFGLFAGISAGEISGDNNIRIKKQKDHRIQGRLDMEFVGGCVQSLMSIPGFESKIKFIANSSLYKVGLNWRYVEVIFHKGKKKYKIVALESNEMLDGIISSSNVFRDWNEIVSQLTGIGYRREEASLFISELVSSQVLIPEIFPNLTGQEFSGKLSSLLASLSERPGIADAFIKAECILNGIKKPGTYFERHEEILKKGREIIPDLNSSRLVQIDMLASYSSCSISRDLSNKVLFGIRILKALTARKPNTVLEKFKENFIDRYDAREVPLPLALDPDVGIGIDGPQGQQMNDPGPLLDGLDFPAEIEQEVPVKAHPLLNAKIKSFDPSLSHYIELDKSDIRQLDIRNGEWPDQVFAMCSLSGEKDIQVNIRLASSGNPSYLIGRFGFLDDGGEIDSHIRDMIKDDISEHSGDCLADIVHLPEDRTGNILQRPSYYGSEINYLANNGGIAEPLSPDDLMLTVSGDEIILKHKNSGRRIIPRLSNAHNYRGRQLPLYQFLCELAREESGLGYFPNWGWLPDHFDFLPGIKYGNLILSQPRWRLELNEELRNTRDSDRLYKEILNWVEMNRLPQKVVWSRGDHDLFISWSNRNIVMAAWENIRRHKYLILRDYIYDEGSPVAGGDGEYANEILLTFKKTLI